MAGSWGVSYWAICLFGALTVSANAQIAPDIATDQEIFAAYCSGVLTTEIGDAPRNSQFPATRRRRTQLARYRDYLAARGVLSRQRSPATVQGVNLSAERGRLDQVACDQQWGTCLDKCLAEVKGGSDQVSDCANLCLKSEPRCEQTYRCSEANLQFPF